METIELKNNFRLYQAIGKIVGQLNSIFFPLIFKFKGLMDTSLYKVLLNHKRFINRNLRDLFVYNSEVKQNSIFLFTVYVYVFALRDFLLLLVYKYKITPLLSYASKRFTKADIMNGPFLLKWLNALISNSLLEMRRFNFSETKYVFIENYWLIEQDEVPADEPVDRNISDETNTKAEDAGSTSTLEEDDIKEATIDMSDKASLEDERELLDILAGEGRESFGGGGMSDMFHRRSRGEGSEEEVVNPDVQISISYLKRLLSLVANMKLFAPPLVGDYLDNLLSYLDSVANFLDAKRNSQDLNDINQIKEYKEKLLYLLKLFNQEGVHLPSYQSIQKLLSVPT